MEIRKVIYADEGKVLTNGEIYGKQIFLAEDMDETAFYETRLERNGKYVPRIKNRGNPRVLPINRSNIQWYI